MANEPVFDPTKAFDVEPSSAQSQTSLEKMTPKQFKQYSAIIRDPKVSPEKLQAWYKAQGKTIENAEEIVNFVKRNPNATLTDNWVKKLEPVNVGSRHMSKLYDGIAGVLGAPVDITSAVINAPFNAYGGEDVVPDNSFGGSEDWKKLFKWAGLIQDEALTKPQSKTEEYTQAVAEGLGQAAIPAGGTVAAGTRLGMRAASAASKASAGRTVLREGLVSAGKAPAVALASEAGGSVGAAVAGKVAEDVAPDSIVAKVIAQTLGGLAGGIGGGVAASSRTRNAVKDVINPSKALKARGIDPEKLPEGVSPKEALKAVKESAPLQREAQAFRTENPEPNAAEVFATPEEKAIKLEQSLKAEAEAFQGKPLKTEEPTPVEVAPSEELGISKRKATELFKEATEAPKKLTINQMEKKLQKEASEFVGDTVAPKTPTAVAAETPSNPATTKTGETPVVPDEDIVTRLTSAIETAGKLNKQQKGLQSAARAEKLRKVIAAQKGTKGEAGFKAELGALKGELPKVDFEEVRGQFTQEEVDGLFEGIKSNERLSTFDKINARTGLAKLLDGAVPSTSEIDLLSKSFPPSFIKAALKHRSGSVKLRDAAGNFLNLPRSLMSSVDLSAPFRQGVFLVGRKEFWKSIGPMFKQFGSEKAFQGVMDSIKMRPTYKLMEESGLSLSDLGGDLTKREEDFVSQWAENIPLVGKAVRASERGYTGFLNKVRADTFDSIVQLSKKAGIDFDADPKALNDIASFVNNATGRGNLGSLSQAGPILNGLFFSPRLIASRVTLLNPVYYAQLSPVVRKEAIKSLLTFGTLATTILGLASAGGADVETDPRSADFAKIKTGDTRYDILGGFQQYIRLGAQLSTNEKKTLKGDIQELGAKYGSDTRLDVLLNFLINKESPVASYVTDYLRGKNAIGEPFDADQDALKRFIPLFFQDLYAAMEEEGAEGVVKTLPAAFGVGVQTYKEDAGFDPAQPSQVETAPPAVSIFENQPEPTFDPAQDFEVEAPAFNPDQSFEESTDANLNAVSVAEDLGLEVTDSGVRSKVEQEKYYRNSNGVAVPGTSRHEKGNALDVRPSEDISPEEIVAEMEAQGYVGVTIVTKKHGTGPHWHIQWESFNS